MIANTKLRASFAAAQVTNVTLTGNKRDNNGNKRDRVHFIQLDIFKKIHISLDTSQMS